MNSSANLRVAISSCPNDTFCFQAWAEECFELPFMTDFFFNDVNTLNRVAMTSAPFDVTKLSASCLQAVSDVYVPLSSGAAFAIHGGPKVLAKTPLSLSDLSNLRLAIPGRLTSAYAAYTLLFGPPREVVEMPSSAVIRAIAEGTCDAGLVIHETCSAAKQHGLIEVVDVGEVYRKRFGSVLPLGVIVARRSLGPETIRRINETLYRSICEARKRPLLAPFVRDRAQELNEDVLWQHINQYVTAETECMTPESSQWITTFTQRISNAPWLIIFATLPEASETIRRLGATRTAPNRYAFAGGEILLCGMGLEAASSAAFAAPTEGYRWLNIGAAGSLDPQLPVGSIRSIKSVALLDGSKDPIVIDPNGDATLYSSPTPVYAAPKIDTEHALVDMEGYAIARAAATRGGCPGDEKGCLGSLLCDLPR